MAWIEQTGKTSWRVRYLRDDGTYGSQSGFHTRKAAEDYAHDLDTDRRRGTWLDPAGAKRPLADWAAVWIETLDVEPRTDENYRRYLRRQILPRWGNTALGDITSLAVTEWWKDLRRRYAASTIAGIRTVLSMMLDDAVDERLIPTNPVHHHRRRDHAPTTAERVWAMPEHIIRIAEQATMRGGPSAGLLVITAAWPAAAGANSPVSNATTSTSTAAYSPSTQTPGRCMSPPAASGSAHRKLPPPRARSRCRRFLVTLLREYLEVAPGSFVFTSPLGCRLRRSTFDRRVFRPAVDGDDRHGLHPVRPGLTFHGLRHSHKTWLIADDIPEIAQAKRLGHHLANRLAEVYSHVAPEIETRLLLSLEQRWHQAHQPQQKRRPTDNRPRRRPTHSAPHTAPAQRTTLHRPTGRSDRTSRHHTATQRQENRRRMSSRIPPHRCTKAVNADTGKRSSRALERPSEQA